jgi:hypothetical protein
MELARGKFEWLGNALDRLYTFQHLELVGGKPVCFADRANDGRFDTLRKMHR